ncbi:MAG TPA: hypothetical protein VGR19_11840 [Allosphingosinicella sp.]|nr:hypothetical protein [Allosphingosinicella sp.]
MSAPLPIRTCLRDAATAKAMDLVEALRCEEERQRARGNYKAATTCRLAADLPMAALQRLATSI